MKLSTHHKRRRAKIDKGFNLRKRHKRETRQISKLVRIISTVQHIPHFRNTPEPRRPVGYNAEREEFDLSPAAYGFLLKRAIGKEPATVSKGDGSFVHTFNFRDETDNKENLE